MMRRLRSEARRATGGWKAAVVVVVVVVCLRAGIEMNRRKLEGVGKSAVTPMGMMMSPQHYKTPLLGIGAVTPLYDLID